MNAPLGETQKSLDAIVTQDFRDIIQSDRYKILEYINRGTVGSVYKAIDIEKDEIVAIKIYDPTKKGIELMLKRGITAEISMKKDTLKRGVFTNLVPREFQRDNVGTPFIVMPFYEKFLDDILKENSDRASVSNKGIGITELIQYSKGITLGLSQYHKKEGKAHADLKPSNIAIDEGNTLLNDFGIATLASAYGIRTGARDNLGPFYLWAPESSKGEPKKTSDVWAFGSLLYRMFTGEYVFEKEMSSMKDPKDFFKTFDSKTIETIIKSKINQNFKGRNKHFGKLVTKCLEYNDSKRYKDGSELANAFEKTVKDYNKTYFQKAKYYLAVGAILAASTTAGMHINRINVDLDKTKQTIQWKDAEITGTVLRYDRWLEKGYTGLDTHEQIKYNNLQEYKKRFKDKQTAYAMLIDSDATYRAIKAIGSEDYGKIKDYFYKHDMEYVATGVLKSEPICDNFARDKTFAKTFSNKTLAELEQKYGPLPNGLISNQE